MFVKKGLLGAVGLAVLAMGIQLPVRAQTVFPETAPVVESVSVSEQVDTRLTLNDLAVNDDDTADLTANAVEPAAWTSPESLSAEGLVQADDMASAQAQPSATDAAAPTLASPSSDESTQLAQRRRTTRGVAASSSSFIGIGADFGTTDDISFAVISKFPFSGQLSVRPSALIGDGFAILVPVTYEFSRFSTDIQGFQILPYAGVGASYVDGNNDDSSFGLLLSGGVDVPLSQRFTANAQANFAGVFSDDSNFGVTVGVGYNFGGFR
ncbi:MAG: outer membrane beta-barrel protein [Phormidesmis sp.]